MFAKSEMERAACPRCGARTEDEASTLCKPDTGPWGDYDCPGDQSDDDGFILQPTAAALKRLDDWGTEQVEKDRAAHG